MLIILPFRSDHIPLLWSWMQEFPERNIDDDGPDDLDSFSRWMQNRECDGVETRIVLLDASPVGAIAWQKISDEIAMFKGICFVKRVHGSGVAREAVSRILSELFASGILRVYAEFFEDNARVDHFLSRFGAEEIESQIRLYTKRAGMPVALKTVVIDEQIFLRSDERRRSHKVSPGSPEDLPAPSR